MFEPKTTVNIHAAKTHLSKLIERAERGEETVIARAGRPVARLVPYREEKRPRVPGAWRGQVRILSGFDDIDEEITRLFETD
jgi:prevent-host-death family protein